MPDGTTILPEHSPLGASSAERWMNCPGSVALTKALGPGADDESDYAAEGTMAHALGSHCLNAGLDCWEALADFPDATAEMSAAVQTYLDFVRALPGKSVKVEQHVERPDIHPQFFGTLDCVVHGAGMIHVIDYKHGVGVVVDAEENPQLKYYAVGWLADDRWGDDIPVRLTIVQPRGFHPDGPIRSWDTTVGALLAWAETELKPAMERAGEMTFDMGEHCRFCPAKLVCPAMRHLGADAALASHETEVLPSMDDAWLGEWYGRLSNLKMFVKAIGDEVQRRCMAGATIPGAKLVYAKVDRVWKPDALEDHVDPETGEMVHGGLHMIFGEKAWETKVLSPAQIEKLPGGKDFCAEYAMKPQAGLTVAPESDKRTAQKPVSNEEVFAQVEIPA